MNKPTAKTDPIRLEIDTAGIATLTIDVAGKSMNVIDQTFISCLQQLVGTVATDERIKGVIIASGKPDFVAGADLKWLLRDMSRKLPVADLYASNTTLTSVLRRLESCGKPVVAAIRGTALGGGLEIALACHRRIAARSPKARIGLPEVTVGLLPGAGGTQRLPRMIGLQRALELLTRGTHLSVDEAHALGIIDEVVDEAELAAAASRWLKSSPEPVQPWDKRGFKVPGGAGFDNAGTMQLFTAAIALTGKAAGDNYPAPMAILSAVYEGTTVPIDAGLRIESRYFTTLLAGPVARNMTRTLFVNKQAADKLARRPQGIAESKVSRLGILGAGMMGAGIAYCSAAAGIHTVLLDRTREEAERGKAYSEKLVKRAVEKTRMTEAKAQTLLDNIQPTTEYADLAGCELVIEAVFEDRDIKRGVIGQADKVIPSTAIFASNTSTLPISGLAQMAQWPAAFIGLHFFSPVDRMPLVEVILGKETSEEALARALDFVRQIRKTPIVVHDSRSFYTSRVFATYTNEGMALLKDGVHPALIENAAVQAGMAVGPLAVSDEVSIELIHKVDRQSRIDLGQAYDAPSAIDVVHEMVERQQRPGRRHGKGFYDYPEGRKKQLWPGLAGVYPLAAEQPDVEEVKRRLLYIQALETARCHEEGVITAPADADIGSILGWGFPAWTGGTLSLVDTVGAATFVAECERMAKAYGPRFAPTGGLRRMAAGGGAYHGEAAGG
ncbi:MAG: enoyl-CoA hydratase/isomerase family protein [Gammaproteobacteria bacterium]|nr:enoyl-CoA hydratase/isomerase family protein [Gammaproteobacteria bacterium]